MKLFYRHISNFTIRHWGTIIVVTVILTGLATYTSSFLGFKGDFIDLLPPHSQSVKDLNIIKERVGGEGYLVLVLEGGETQKKKEFTEKLVPELKKFKEVTYVEYKFDKTFFEDRNLLYIDESDLKTLETRLQEKIQYERNKVNPFYINLLDEKNDFNIDDIKEKYSKAEIKDYYITKNPERLVLLIKPHGFASDLNFCKRLLAKTQSAIAALDPTSFDPALTVKYTGRYVTRIEETDFMFSDLKLTTIIALIGIFSLLSLYTRSLTTTLFIGAPLMISLMYELAFATLTIGYLNLVSSILLGILSGMGIDYSVHLYLRYLEERRNHKSLEQAIHIIHSSTGKPMLLAGITTVAACLGLSPSEVVGFSQFGWVCGSGIVFCMLNSYFLLPALIIAREKIKPMRYKMALVTAPHDFLHYPKKYPKPYATLAVFAVFGLISLWGITQIHFDYDFRKLSADKNKTLALQEEISDAFGVSLSPTIVYSPKLEDIPKISDVLTQVKKSTPSSTIKEGLSLFSYVPEHQEEKIPHIRQLGEIGQDKVLRFLEGEPKQQIENLKRWAQVRPFGINDLPQHLRQQFDAANGYTGSFLFVFPAIDLWQGKDVIRYANEIRIFKEKAQKKDLNISIASEAVIFSDILTLIETEGPKAILFCFLAILLILWIDIRNIRSVFLVLTPVITGILCTMGVMYIFNIKLNFMNSVVFPILLGLGIDNGVYIQHRYQEMGQGSLRFVLRHTGAAIFLSSTTTMIGFGSLLFAVHKGLNSVGLLAFIGMASCFVVSMSLFPAILQILEDRSIHHAQKLAQVPPQEEIKKL